MTYSNYFSRADAKLMWCPFAHVRQAAVLDAVPLVTTSNRDDRRSLAGSHCLGNDCAAWRWRDPQSSDLDGYCGLVGQPVLVGAQS